MPICQKIRMETNDPELSARIFYMFSDGWVRDMSFGLGKIMKYHDFEMLYLRLISIGYKEVSL